MRKWVPLLVVALALGACRGQVPSAQDLVCVTVTPASICVTTTPRPVATPSPTWTPIPATGTRLVYEEIVAPFMAQDLGSDWGHDFWLQPRGLARQILKVGGPWDMTWTDLYDPTEPVTHSGGPSMADLQRLARENPQLWWILGEEPNQWVERCPQSALFSGKLCKGAFLYYPSPEVFAHWFRDAANAVLRGWEEAGSSEGKIVAFYFMQDSLASSSGCGNLGRGTPTAIYLDRFHREWRRLWPGDEVPLDGLAYNFHPSCSREGQEAWGGGIERTVTYWVEKRAEMNARPWLAGKLFWGETMAGRWDYPPGNALNAGYLCDTARRVTNLRAWAARTPWVDALLWFPTVRRAGRWPGFRYSALYHGEEAPRPGDLTPAGKAFRDGALPPECR